MLFIFTSGVYIYICIASLNVDCPVGRDGFFGVCPGSMLDCPSRCLVGHRDVCECVSA